MVVKGGECEAKGLGKHVGGDGVCGGRSELSEAASQARVSV